jgi:hypothetical protein
MALLNILVKFSHEYLIRDLELEHPVVDHVRDRAQDHVANFGPLVNFEDFLKNLQMVLAEFSLWMLRNLSYQSNCKRNVALGNADIVFEHILVHFEEFIV